MSKDQDYANFVARMGSFSDDFSSLADDSVLKKASDAGGVLAHFGIKGMRWGVRRSRDEGSRAASKAQAKAEKKQAKAEGKKPSAEHETTRALMAKSTKALSNAEMKKLNERLRLETELKRLNPSAIQKGNNFAKGILAAGTTITAIYALSQSPLGKSIQKAVVNRGQMKIPGF